MRETDGATIQATAPGSADSWLDQLRERWLPQADELLLDVRLHDRPIRVRISRSAQAASAQLKGPLTVEMELYFSCLVRKAVRFHPAGTKAEFSETFTLLLDNLVLQFHPVTTQHCRVQTGEAAPPLETMPVKRPQAFVPRWLDIDFHHGEWVGEYGY